MRVVILKKFAKDNFPVTPLLDYALEVEKITVSKVCIFMTREDQIDGLLFLETQFNLKCRRLYWRSHGRSITQLWLFYTGRIR